MSKLLDLIQDELGSISAEEMEKAEKLINEYGNNDFLLALIKASYNNLKDLNNVERILKESLYEKAQINLDEILSTTATDYTKLVESKFDRQLSLIEKYLLNNSCENFNLEELNKALNDGRLKETYTIHRVVEILNNL